MMHRITGYLRTNKLIMGLVALVAVIGLLATNVQAQNTQNVTLSVSPTVFELAANPGENLEQSFKLINATDVDLVVRAIPKNFVAEGEDGGVNLTEDETSFSLASWITVTPEVVNVSANGSQVFDFTINVPANAEPGGHFGSVIVQTEAVNIEENGPAVSQEVGPLILLDVPGDVREEASIVNFRSLNSVWSDGPVVLQTRVQNSGTVHFKPKGTIVIKDMFGRERTTIDLEEKNVLPDSIRRLTNEWDPGFTLGRYTADLTLIYGDDDTILMASTSFIVFPYKVVIPVVVGLIILVVLIVRYRDRLSRALRVLSGKA